MTLLHCYPFPTKWEECSLKLSITDAKRTELRSIPTGEENSRTGIVAFDHATRKWFAIRHFPCFCDSWECCCAAQAVQLADKSEKWEWPPVVFLEEDEDDE